MSKEAVMKGNRSGRPGRRRVARTWEQGIRHAAQGLPAPRLGQAGLEEWDSVGRTLGAGHGRGSGS